MSKTINTPEVPSEGRRAVTDVSLRIEGHKSLTELAELLGSVSAFVQSYDRHMTLPDGRYF